MAGVWTGLPTKGHTDYAKFVSLALPPDVAQAASYIGISLEQRYASSCNRRIGPAGLVRRFKFCGAVTIYSLLRTLPEHKEVTTRWIRSLWFIPSGKSGLNVEQRLSNFVNKGA
jgi:hypothetical protein